MKFELIRTPEGDVYYDLDRIVSYDPLREIATLDSGDYVKIPRDTFAEKVLGDKPAPKKKTVKKS